MYRVEWLQSALDQLAAAWGQADSELRQAITAATNVLDRQLVVAPDVYGESRGGTARVHFVSPLSVNFSVDDDQRLVTVLSVRVYRPRPRA
jgi:multidrug efflux pump subunit AcrA (membrane-fusion protein)